MFKKLIILLLISLLFLSACSAEPPVINDQTSKNSSSSDKTENSEIIVNPLTGEAGLSKDKLNKRPVAVMVNNVLLAQPVQAGISDADIVYETEVESSITRLMAVYQDISKVDKVGSVRSARYPYVDLALGHDAIYIHSGQDPTYCAPHLKDIDHISVDSNILGAKRIQNGLNKEHTLYVLGNDLWKNLASKFRTEKKEVNAWQNFAKEKNAVTLTDGSALKVTVSFTSSYQTEFTFDSNTKTYIRSVSGTKRTDYLTGKTTKISNLFVLYTTITNYPDGYHRKVALDSGNGYFITNGTYQKIKWSKGASSNGFSFTDDNGNEITLNQGKSFVCIVNKTRPEPTFE